MNPALNRNNARLAAKRAKRQQAVRKQMSTQARRDFADLVENGTIRLLAAGFIIGLVVIVGPVAFDLIAGGAL
jgi:hypothetical protein